MLPGHPYRVVVASLNIFSWGVGCHAQTGRECQSYDPRDTVVCRMQIEVLGGAVGEAVRDRCVPTAFVDIKNLGLLVVP